ncbi:MAG: LapA family protein [Rhodocyclaceae bacterium]|nr:LapA family protein [Rhodocyclaceae bacterium]MBK6552585.1 LapA family protein [Rhodocyclaceae bacterium]MBK6676099.1 LapA family protein [Rhodocyclaceae bacterium]MBK7815131.1 LapA family protein [Rhodocyclaceae bacterium]MBK9312123.1 LapA family protein [Rhodocyclaceae bacterium]
MAVLLWLLRGIVFIALFGLAVKNSGPVELRFYLDGVWVAPLSFVILAAFALGAVIGLTATLGTIVRRGRELGRLRKRAAAEQEKKRPGRS